MNGAFLLVCAKVSVMGRRGFALSVNDTPVGRALEHPTLPVALRSSTQGAWPAAGYMFSRRSRVLITGVASHAPTPLTAPVPTSAPPLITAQDPSPPPPSSPQRRRSNARNDAARGERGTDMATTLRWRQTGQDQYGVVVVAPRAKSDASRVACHSLTTVVGRQSRALARATSVENLRCVLSELYFFSVE